MHSVTSVPILHLTAPRTSPVLSSVVASIAPTRPSWGSRVRTFLGFNVVTCLWGHISISKTLQELHWLPIKWCINYKVTTLMYKFLESGEPTYLRSCTASKIFRRSLRSSVDDMQFEPCSSRTKIGSSAFRCAAPVILNCLLYDIRAALSVSIFRSRLKTLFHAYLLTSYFGLNVLEINFFNAPLIQFDEWFYHIACAIYKFSNNNNNNNNNFGSIKILSIQKLSSA